MLGCTNAPLPGCLAAGKTLVLVNEKTFGKEKLKVLLDRLVAPVTPPQFGNPVSGTTTYAVCLYDQADGLVATMRVNRAGSQCGTSPCWKAILGKGIKYSDKLTQADGIQQIVAKGGEAGKGKIIIKGKNDIGRSQTALPTRVAVPLAGNRRATAQLVGSDAACFSGTATSVTTADGHVFKGTAP
ncbi:MAG: hypothetical protein ACREQL_04940 [Candidatus Binatia bacterium]